MTRISEIRKDMRGIDIEGEVVEKRPIYSKEGTDIRVQNLVVRDDTGSITVAVWREKTDVSDRASPGDRIRVTGGISTYREGYGLQLNSSRSGTIEVIPREARPLDDILTYEEKQLLASLNPEERRMLVELVRALAKIRR